MEGEEHMDGHMAPLRNAAAPSIVLLGIPTAATTTEGIRTAVETVLDRFEFIPGSDGTMVDNVEMYGPVGNLDCAVVTFTSELPLELFLEESRRRGVTIAGKRVYPARNFASKRLLGDRGAVSELPLGVVVYLSGVAEAWLDQGKLAAFFGGMVTDNDAVRSVHVFPETSDAYLEMSSSLLCDALLYRCMKKPRVLREIGPELVVCRGSDSIPLVYADAEVEADVGADMEGDEAEVTPDEAEMGDLTMDELAFQADMIGDGTKDKADVIADEAGMANGEAGMSSDLRVEADVRVEGIGMANGVADMRVEGAVADMRVEGAGMANGVADIEADMGDGADTEPEKVAVQKPSLIPLEEVRLNDLRKVKPEQTEDVIPSPAANGGTITVTIGETSSERAVERCKFDLNEAPAHVQAPESVATSVPIPVPPAPALTSDSAPVPPRVIATGKKRRHEPEVEVQRKRAFSPVPPPPSYDNPWETDAQRSIFVVMNTRLPDWKERLERCMADTLGELKSRWIRDVMTVSDRAAVVVFGSERVADRLMDAYIEMPEVCDEYNIVFYRHKGFHRSEYGIDDGEVPYFASKGVVIVKGLPSRVRAHTLTGVLTELFERHLPYDTKPDRLLEVQKRPGETTAVVQMLRYRDAELLICTSKSLKVAGRKIRLERAIFE